MSYFKLTVLVGALACPNYCDSYYENIYFSVKKKNKKTIWKHFYSKNCLKKSIKTNNNNKKNQPFNSLLK